MVFNEIIGNHHRFKLNQHVTEFVNSNSSVLSWSNDIFKTFPAVQILVIHKAMLKKFSRGDFHSASNFKNVEVQI